MIRAFPTPFFVWPDYYEWSRTMEVTDGADSTSFVTASNSITLPIYSNPQPPVNFGYFAVDPTAVAFDPFGLFFSVVIDNMDYSQYCLVPTYEMFPDQPVLRNCNVPAGGPNLLGFTQTSWDTATSTSFEDVQSKSTIASPGGISESSGLTQTGGNWLLSG